MYIQIDYPILLHKYFKMFEIFDLNFLPNIVPDNKYIMKSPKGFFEEEVDSLLLRNASQYLIISSVLLFIYIVFKSLEILLLTTKELKCVFKIFLVVA